MDIKIQDRTEKIEMLRMALNMVGVSVDYKITDLILRVIEGFNKHGKEFNLVNALKIEKEWDLYLHEYFKQNES